MKQALRWWFERQATVLEHQSEAVHNGLMQDLFAVRRSAELATIEPKLVEAEQDKLRHLEQIYRSLEQVIDVFSPAYVRESLPLAIQSKLSQWKSEHPTIATELDVPSYWTYETSYQNHLVIYILDELLRVINLSTGSLTRLKISLSSCSDLKTLSIECTYSEFAHVKGVLNSGYLRHLQQTFNLLSGGKCFFWSKGRELLVRFQWRAIQSGT